MLFDSVGVPPKDPKNPDVGRYAVTKDPRDMGAFKTPTVRDAARRAPYLHDGSVAGLREVLTSANRNDRHGVTSHLTPAEIEDLIAFLLILPYE